MWRSAGKAATAYRYSQALRGAVWASHSSYRTVDGGRRSNVVKMARWDGSANSEEIVGNREFP